MISSNFFNKKQLGLTKTSTLKMINVFCSLLLQSLRGRRDKWTFFGVKGFKPKKKGAAC